jgi:hypothetical protein
MARGGAVVVGLRSKEFAWLHINLNLHTIHRL